MGTTEGSGKGSPTKGTATKRKKARASSKERGTGDKRERILRAAIRVFARKGFYATRVSEIAKAAGVADGTIYLYFKNKDDVLVSIFQDRIGKLLTFLREVAANDEGAESQILEVVHLQLGLLEGRRELAEVVTVNLRQSSKMLKQYAAPLFAEYLEVIANVIANGQKEGVFRDDVSPRIAARALWGGLDGLALTYALGTSDKSALRKAARHFGSIFLEGLRAR